MALPLVLDALFDAAGPFLIPVALFVLGLVGYGVLLSLGRLDLVDDGRSRPASPSSGVDGSGDEDGDGDGDGDGDCEGHGSEPGDADRPSSDDGV